MRILAIGPFLGDFKSELMQFKPYARWLSKAVEWDNIYISTHANRLFLYDFIPEENLIPVYQHFSRDEENQKGYIHKKINKKDYNLIIRTFKEEIIERENCNRKDIEIYNLSYSKNNPSCSIYNKIFEKLPDINLEIPKKHKNRIIFIPDKTEKLEKLAYIYNWLKINYDVLIVGNTDTWFSNDNVILDRIDYFENGWKYIIQYISESKAVICPLSYWVVISNMLSKPVFGWGNNPGQYRVDGIYNFGNKNISLIPASKNISPDIIINNIRSFIKKIER